jgi:putative ABC transport system permease protein
MPFALAFLNLVLFVCPREFRRAYRAAIRADFHDIAAQEYALHGFPGFATYAGKAYTDIIVSGLGERGMMMLRDLIYAVRSLRKTPFFTAVVIATLAVAIAANGAVFSVLDAVLLKPLPYADPHALVAVFGRLPESSRATFSYPNFADLRASSRAFGDLAVASNDRATLSGQGEPRSLFGQQVSFSYFAVFGARPQLGRFFTAADERLGSAHALVLSHAAFVTTFGGNPTIVGSTVRLDGEPYQIVGVAPAGFVPPADRGVGYEERVAYWAVIRPSHATGEDQRANYSLSVYARMRAGVSLATANADTGTVMARLAERYVSTNKHFGANVVSLEDVVVGPVRPLLFGVFAAVAGVLLVACANVANLLLSRAATRERELAVRYAIGASRARIISQILTETLLFAAVGGIFGVGLAAASVREFVALRPPGIPRLDAIAFDGNAALFTFVVVVFSTLAAGLIPALTLSRVQLADALKAAGRGGDRSRGARARAAFVVAEIAITLALVVASGLVVRSFIALTSTPLGFDPMGVTAVYVASLPQRYSNQAALTSFERRAVEREAAVPGAIDVAWSGVQPFRGPSYGVSFTMPEKPLPPGDERSAAFNVVSPGYFNVLRIPLGRGRLFNDGDRLGTQPVAIINEAFAHAYYGNTSAIGKRITPGISGTEAPPATRTIVGIAADTRTQSYAEPPQPEIYLPASQIGVFPNGTLLVRAQPGIDRAALVAAIRALDPEVVPAEVKPLSENLANDAARTRLSAIALGTLATIALLLAVAGIYGVLSYSVAQRTHEFGIRKALGARGSHVLGDVLVRAARLAALGILIGLVLAGLAARVVATQLYGVGQIDPLTYGAVVIILFAAAIIAALIPALRAMRVDPIVALRYE